MECGSGDRRGLCTCGAVGSGKGSRPRTPPSNAALEHLPRGAHAQRAFSTAGPAVRNRV